MARYVKLARRDWGLSQKEAGLLVGISQTAMSKWDGIVETGQDVTIKRAAVRRALLAILADPEGTRAQLSQLLEDAERVRVGQEAARRAAAHRRRPPRGRGQAG